MNNPDTLPPFHEPDLARWLRFFWRLTGRSRWMDRQLSLILKYRDFLPKTLPENISRSLIHPGFLLPAARPGLGRLPGLTPSFF